MKVFMFLLLLSYTNCDKIIPRVTAYTRKGLKVCIPKNPNLNNFQISLKIESPSQEIKETGLANTPKDGLLCYINKRISLNIGNDIYYSLRIETKTGILNIDDNLKLKAEDFVDDGTFIRSELNMESLSIGVVPQMERRPVFQKSSVDLEKIDAKINNCIEQNNTLQSSLIIYSSIGFKFCFKSSPGIVLLNITALISHNKRQEEIYEDLDENGCYFHPNATLNIGERIIYWVTVKNNCGIDHKVEPAVWIVKAQDFENYTDFASKSILENTDNITTTKNLEMSVDIRYSIDESIDEEYVLNNYPVTIKAFRPRGFKACIKTAPRVTIFKFSANINKNLGLTERAEIEGEVKEPVNGTWCYYNGAETLKLNDILYYRISTQPGNEYPKPSTIWPIDASNFEEDQKKNRTTEQEPELKTNVNFIPIVDDVTVENNTNTNINETSHNDTSCICSALTIDSLLVLLNKTEAEISGLKKSKIEYEQDLSYYQNLYTKLFNIYIEKVTKRSNKLVFKSGQNVDKSILISHMRDIIRNRVNIPESEYIMINSNIDGNDVNFELKNFSEKLNILVRSMVLLKNSKSKICDPDTCCNHT